MNLQPGSIIKDRYQIESILGEGGFAVVYKATDLQLNRIVALKIMKFRLDEEGSSRFYREAKLVAGLQHKNVVSVFAADTLVGDIPFLINEYLSGQTLRSLLLESKRLNCSDSFQFLKQMSSGLSYVHDAGIIHRDLSPANIFVVEDSSGITFKLLDFGLSKMFASENTNTITATGEVFGNASYLAPEVLKGSRASFQSDIYSLGCILYEAASGQRAFAADSELHVLAMQQTSYPKKPHLDWSDKSKEELFELTILRCLQKNQANRFSSCSELTAMVENSGYTTATFKVPEQWSDVTSTKTPTKFFANRQVRIAFSSFLLLALTLALVPSILVQLCLTSANISPSLEDAFAQSIRKISPDNADKLLLHLAKRCQESGAPLESADKFLELAEDYQRKKNYAGMSDCISSAFANLKDAPASAKGSLLRMRLLKILEEQNDNLVRNAFYIKVKTIGALFEDSSNSKSTLKAQFLRLTGYNPGACSKEELKCLANVTTRTLSTLRIKPASLYQVWWEELINETYARLPEEGYKVTEAWIAAQPEDCREKVKARIFRCKWFYRMGDKNKSAQLADEILKSKFCDGKLRAALLCIRSELELTKRQYQKVIDTVNEAISCGPTRTLLPELLSNKITALHELGKDKEAQELRASFELPKEEKSNLR